MATSGDFNLAVDNTGQPAPSVSSSVCATVDDSPHKYFPDRTRLISYNDMGHLPPSIRGTEYPLEARI
jgi:hypothetical protein